MKRFLAVALLAISSIAFGATLNPVQLLNPAGSSIGQTIVSTGASSAPGWGTIPLSGLSSVAANTVIANFTGSSAAPVAFSMPSCNSSGSALQYASGTGLTCASNYALTTGATFTGAITPSQTAGIIGTTTNNNANTGSVGEYATNTTTGTSLTSGAAANMTSISLTAGDWDVSGEVTYSAGAGCVPTLFQQSVSTTSATSGGAGAQTVWSASFSTASTNVMPTPRVRISLSATTTVYLVGTSLFSGGTMTANGFIRARRVR
ncbi:hypothetical protein UA17_01779 [Burkholderia multivorans]|uniref:hypothetical protein n=1 Tax=Burkholderia multivorans TaxID=87883 RepID=UPI0009E0E163|nr:hypothetical protein [Burkholderia multivorans]SAK19280.1 hypothetical protein UA17_01779 [Burkholderia multivorans]